MEFSNHKNKILIVSVLGLPDTDWLKELIPEVDIDKFRHGLIGKGRWGLMGGDGAYL